MKLKIDFLKSSFDQIPEHLAAAIDEIPNAEVNMSAHGCGLSLTKQGLAYVDEELGELHLDFVEDHINYARKSHRGKSELIAKAVGLSKGYKQVFDTTMGLAQDAFFLAKLGAQVQGCERSPIVFLLLRDAIHRAQIENLQVSFGDAKTLLEQSQKRGIGYSVIYVDPMFPHKKKSALPRKEMQIFRKLIGDDEDGGELLMLARKFAKDRIVVKRPLKAEELGEGVVHKFEGSTVRYDLYSPLQSPQKDLL